jgi:hypothetical protein
LIPLLTPVSFRCTVPLSQFFRSKYNKLSCFKKNWYINTVKEGEVRIRTKTVQIRNTGRCYLSTVLLTRLSQAHMFTPSPDQKSQLAAMLSSPSLTPLPPTTSTELPPGRLPTCRPSRSVSYNENMLGWLQNFATRNFETILQNFIIISRHIRNFAGMLCYAIS